MTAAMNDTHNAASRAILIGASLMLALSMGMRQSMGLMQPDAIADLGITAADYSLAIALQNIVWGVTQPFVGALADRFGARRIAMAGGLIYLCGLLVARLADGPAMLVVGLGVCIGLAMSCTGSTLAMSITSRTVSAARRSVAMGAVSAVGSMGLLIVSPIAQTLLASGGWTLALAGYAGLAALIVAAAFFAGGADRISRVDTGGPAQSVVAAVREAGSHSGFLLMASAYFVCGLQLVFLTTHLPNYIAICGMPSSVAAATLALIGLFNAGGTLLFGWLGGRYSRRLLLGGIYVLRSVIIIAYFSSVPTPTTTMLFGAAMGALWLSVIPLVNGLVVQLFGMRYMATLVGLAFFSHQLGSFLGAWGGGVIYASMGSYDLAWKSAVAIGIVAGIAQMGMNIRPVPRMMAQA